MLGEEIAELARPVATDIFAVFLGLGGIVECGGPIAGVFLRILALARAVGEGIGFDASGQAAARVSGLHGTDRDDSDRWTRCGSGSRGKHAPRRATACGAKNL